MKKIALLCLLGLCSCQFSKERLNNEKDKTDAIKVVDSFYQFAGAKQISKAIQLFNTGNGADTSKLKEFITGLSNQAPTLKERKLDHWNTRVVLGLEANSIYNLYYINKYESSELKVSIVLFKDITGQIKIGRYQANPDKFQ